MKVDADAATNRAIYMPVLGLTGTVFASTNTVSLPNVMIPKIYHWLSNGQVSSKGVMAVTIL